MRSLRRLATTASRKIIFGLMAALGSLALIAPAQANVGCSFAGAAAVFTLCSHSETPQSDGSTQFTYQFGTNLANITAYIPLLDLNAIVSGTFKIEGSVVTPDIITDAATIADLWSPGSGVLTGKDSRFADPLGLLDISLIDHGPTTVQFDSYDAIAEGPMLGVSTLNGGIDSYIDPPLPGTIPEPATLALLGSGLFSMGLLPRRSRRPRLVTG